MSETQPRTVLAQHWPFPGGEVTLTIRTAQPLPAAAWVALGPVAAEIEKLVASLSSEGETDA